MSQKWASALGKSGLDTLTFQDDTVTRETIEAYKTGTDLEKVILSIKIMVKAKKQLRIDTPVIDLRRPVMNHNKRKITDGGESVGRVS